MSRECPKCRRPNSDKALRCIYCAAVFAKAAPPPPASSPSAEPEPAKKAAPHDESYLVILSPQQEIANTMVRKFALELGVDNFTARHKLRAPAPWTVRVFHAQGPAQELAQALAAMGLDAYVVKQSGIQRISERFQAMGVKSMGPDQTVFLDAAGNVMPLPHADAFLVVRGRIREKTERELPADEDAPRIKLGKIAVGEESGQEKGRLREAIEGFEIRPRPGLLRWSLKGHNIEIMDIYRRSTTRSIRVVESEFDYSGLGSEMTASGLLNFTRILNNILSRDPAPLVDSSFNTVGYSFTDVPKQDKIRSELEAAFGTSESNKKVYDNRAFFDDHSARIFLHCLRAGNK